MGYNAVTSKLSDYAPKILNMGFSAALLIANVTAILAFIPIGIISSKIGRKKTILFGVTLLAFCFGSVYFITPNTGFFTLCHLRLNLGLHGQALTLTVIRWWLNYLKDLMWADIRDTITHLVWQLKRLPHF